MQETQYITGPNLARRLGLKPQTIRSWRLSGYGPPYIRLGDRISGRVLYRIADVEQWLAARVVESTAAERAKAAAANGANETGM